MSITIKNEKGLNATSCYEKSLIEVEKIEKMKVALKIGLEKGLMTEAEHQLATAFLQQIESLPGRSEPGYYSRKISVTYVGWPTGWGNEHNPVNTTKENVEKEWETLKAIRAQYKKAVVIFDKVSWDLKELDTNLPKESSLKKSASWIVEEVDPNAAARAGFGWAIWMGSPRELGYMDGKKRPAGAASARLFESEAAAVRTAKAARFGTDRGPAAIVKLMIEPLELVESSGGGDEVRAEMARIESASITQALEEASLERLQAVLGDSSAVNVAIPEDPEGSLAGSDTGYALWRGYKDMDGSGYVNYNGGAGPLNGALLRSSLKDVKNNMYSYGAVEGHTVVKVKARPVEIGQLIGEPNVKELNEAIELEHQRQEAASLSKANVEALKARAAALQSGAAQPAPRRRSL